MECGEFTGDGFDGAVQAGGDELVELVKIFGRHGSLSAFFQVLEPGVYDLLDPAELGAPPYGLGPYRAGALLAW